ncbi:hypothetical protein [Bradyrhizobium erythrophlei]|nr:hypothetical protein [Bradyrhizobium erythrophlei]
MISAVIFIDRTFVHFELSERAAWVFALIEAASDAVPMMNAPFFHKQNLSVAALPTPDKDDDWARAALAGTRMLIAEECFDAMLQMLIDAGLVHRSCAAVMLDRLSERLLLHASGRTETHWAIRTPELIDQATRLSRMAATLKTVIGGVS